MRNEVVMRESFFLTLQGIGRCVDVQTILSIAKINKYQAMDIAAEVYCGLSVFLGINLKGKICFMSLSRCVVRMNIWIMKKNTFHFPFSLNESLFFFIRKLKVHTCYHVVDPSTCILYLR